MQKLYNNQLEASLKKGLAPCYLVFGEEPLQKMEAIDLLRSVAKKAGFVERQSFTLEANFDWNEFFNEFAAMSLFASQRIIELDLGNGKLTPAINDALKQVPSMLHADIILVLHAQRSASDIAKTAWYKALDSTAIQVQFYPLDDQQFMRWLRERAQQLSLKLQQDALQLLQHHANGNLLAARQELEKLAITHQGQWIDAAFIQHYLADQSHYTVFQLVDSLLAGQGEEALHRLDRLLQQDTEPVVIAWQLQKELFTLLQLQQLGTNPSADDFKSAGIWPKRQPLYQQALLRLSSSWLQFLLQELNAFDRGFKSGQLTAVHTALAHLVTLFINPVPRLFSLQKLLED